MEEINYGKLLNHKAINRVVLISIISMSVVLPMLVFLSSINKESGGIFTLIIVVVLICLSIILYFFVRRYKEKYEIRRLTNFYNDCIKNNNCLEVDDDLKSGFIDLSKDIILNKLELIWEPEFVYDDDETRVYRVENTEIIIVIGYFKDISVYKAPKRKYTMVFNDCKYNMCFIDNLICWEKGTYWSVFYTKQKLKNNTIDYTNW